MAIQPAYRDTATARGRGSTRDDGPPQPRGQRSSIVGHPARFRRNREQGPRARARAGRGVRAGPAGAARCVGSREQQRGGRKDEQQSTMGSSPEIIVGKEKNKATGHTSTD